jgi:peptidoglycan/LPS O-acetylase OafA/YrhL
MYITEERLLRKNNNFDALRLTAALFVFISHAYGVMELGNIELLSLITGKRYVFSSLGLAIFFSMSGFLVCRSLVISESIKQFLINRFLRIWPAYAICILFCILFVGLPLSDLPVIQFISHPQTVSFFFINISLLSSTMHLPGVFNGKAVNPSIWTIPIEVRLYLLLMLTYLVARLRFRQWLLLFTLTIWCAHVFIPEKLQHTLLKQHVLSAIHLGIYFLMGACFYLYKERIPLKFYIWLILLAYFLSLHTWFRDHVGAAQIPFFVYSFMWVAFRWPRLPSIKADISYGFYLFGGPIQVVAMQTIGQQINFVVYLLITGSCTTILALLSWHLIEKRALSLKYVFNRKQASTTAP